MTSIVKVTAHPQEPNVCKVLVQNYDTATGNVTNEATHEVPSGETREFAVYSGQQVIVSDELPDAPEVA
jgi:hypothetical protein